MKRGRIQNQRSGFSLIELLIVIGILGLVGLIAIPSISNTFRFSVQSTGREIATLIKDTVNSAQITGRVHRIAYDLKNQQYWVESTSESTLLKSDETLKKEKERSRGYFSLKEAEEDEKKNKGGFRQENLLTKKKRSLAIGVSIKDVVTEQGENPITEGMAYTHIFPQGLTEKTLVHLKDTANNEITLTVSNLLGRCYVEGRYIEAKDFFKR
ncbi:MAG: type II secretion system GspH family protein [Bdellovibrionales bacterium]|nr:type II secretion system GspH family protein [Bdellovibrionales bacterium]